MNSIKKNLSNPYIYIFFSGYYGVWILWNSIKIPYHNPAGIISYLPSIHYNPVNNILRFLLAVLIPPLGCLVFWLITKTATGKNFIKHTYIKKISILLLLTASLSLALFMGITQGSTNKLNNPVDTYGGPYQHAMVDTFHEGESLGPAISYQYKGLKPYKDFVLVHGVVQDPLISIIGFKLFGRSIGAVRAINVILLMVTFCLYFLLLLVLFRWNVLEATIGLGVLGILLVPSAHIPSIGKYLIGANLPIRDITTILFLIVTILGIRNSIANRAKLLISCSLAIGIISIASFGVSIDRALYIATLSIVWLIMLLSIMQSRRFIKIVLLPYVLGSLGGIIILGFVIKWAYKDFLSYLLTMSRYKEYLDGIVFGQPNLGVTLILLAVSAGILIGATYVWKLFYVQPQAKNLSEKICSIKHSMGYAVKGHYTLIILFTTSVFFLRSAIGRALPDHFSYSVQWLYLLATFMIINYLFSKKRSANRTSYVFIALMIFGSTYLSYARQVKAIDIREDTFPIHLKDNDVIRPDYIQTAQYIKQNLHGEETFVTLTSEASWYYLVNKPSPIRFGVIWYAFTASQRHEIANALTDNAKIKYAITNNNWTSNFDYIPNPDRFPEVYKVLSEHYEPIAGFGQQTVWVRK